MSDSNAAAGAADFKPVVPVGINLDTAMRRLAERTANGPTIRPVGAPPPAAAPEPQPAWGARPGPGHNQPPGPTPGIGHNQGPEFDWEMPPPAKPEISFAAEGGYGREHARRAGQQPPPPPVPLQQHDPGQVVAVTIDGQQQAVPLPELVAGYLRMADYTKKTQALAAEVKKAGDAHAAFAAARDQLLAQIPQTLEGRLAELRKIDWRELQRTNPAKFQEMSAERLAVGEQLEELNRAVGAKVAEDQARAAYLVQTGHQVLCRVLPGWADDAVRPKMQAAINAHLLKNGFTADELKQPVTDPRLIKLAFDSTRLAALEARRVVPQAFRPAAPPPRPMPPGGRRNGVVGGNGAGGDADETFAARPNIINGLELLKARRSTTTRM